MIVARPVRTIYLAHSLTNGLAETNPHGNRIVRRWHAGHQLKTALQLLPEIKQQSRMFGWRTFQHTQPIIRQIRLSVARNKQIVRSRNSRTILLPDNTDRSDILPCPMVSLLANNVNEPIPMNRMINFFRIR